MTLTKSVAIRACKPPDFPAALEVINAAAKSYRAFLPPQYYHEPLMTPEELRREAARMDWYMAVDRDGAVVGVMGLERVRDVALIRHGYVRPERQRQGIGEALLVHLEGLVETGTRILVGTYQGNSAAQAHLEKHGYRRVEDSDAVLRTYYEIPDRQRETSIAFEKIWGRVAQSIHE